MEENNFDYLYWKVKDEGFHYCFTHYSSFNNIKDEKFHELRLAYLNSANELEQYIANKYKEEQENEFEED